MLLLGEKGGGVGAFFLSLTAFDSSVRLKTFTFLLSLQHSPQFLNQKLPSVVMFIWGPLAGRLRCVPAVLHWESCVVQLLEVGRGC